jgi:glycosyltransferase involved in cell wall biosynthesis
MTVVYVLDVFPAVSETFVLTEVRELVRQGVDVRIIARRRPPLDAPLHEGTAELLERTTYLSKRPSAVAAALVRSPGRSLRALAWAVRTRPFERGSLRAFADACAAARTAPAGTSAVHAHFAHTSATTALLLARLLGARFSFTAHAYDVRISRPHVLRRKIAEASFAAAVSEFTSAELGGGVEILRNGVDLERLGTIARRDEVPPRILTVARHVEKKGLDVAIDAARILSERGLSFTWEVVGEGRLAAELERRAAGAVSFAGALADSEVRDQLGRASVFVLPARVASNGDSDALPVALVEAAAAGVPIVTTAVGGISELVEAGISGLVVEPDDPAAVADAVERLLGDRELAERLASGARDAARAYDVRESVRRLRGLLAGGPA